MNQSLNERKCPGCGGQNLKPGKLGVHKHTFIPAGRWMMLGYVTTAFACLDCGLVDHYLNQSDLEDIRRHT